MKLIDAMNKLREFERRQGEYIYPKRWIGRLFVEKGSCLDSTLNRLIDAEVLHRACRGVYVYNEEAHMLNIIYQVALRARAGEHMFESLESAAAQWGLISQVPLDRVMFMTTGRSGVLQTRYGTIEYVHTEAGLYERAMNTVHNPTTGVRIATKEYTLHNLKRCGRSLDLVEEMMEREREG